MDNNLLNKTALVTGGGSGIGKSVCHRLAQSAAKIIVVDLNLEAAQVTAEKIVNDGGQAEAYACDVSSHQQVTSMFETIEQKDRIDIVVNNAGIAHIGNIEACSEADLDRLFNVNVKGVYNIMAAAIPGMKSRQSGNIINLASVASSVGIADRFAYSMTKGAVLTMTLSVAKDYINCGIRCNCVSPARVHTPFVDNFLEQNYPDNKDEMFEALSKSQPIGRMGTPEEVAELIAFLSSDASSFITGTNVPVDGGFVTLNN
jgi:NAD(P)-dependent dehydrogenase (short-subunit alcohol dehydrogenase family)|tara:strand:+ start:118 stop:894 length:777 start_codon:yes stop_codon:yes gene_type:complete